MPRHVEDNRDMYNTGDFERTKDRIASEIFPVRVLSADYERHVLTVQSYKDNLTYTEVAIFPANYSSMETTDLTMPEQGAVALPATGNMSQDSAKWRSLLGSTRRPR